MRTSNRMFVPILGAIALVGAIVWGLCISPTLTAPVLPFQAPHPPVEVQLQQPQAPTKHLTGDAAFRDKLSKAVAPLYADIDGSTRFICTATAIQKNSTGYVFLTARHCVQGIPGIRNWFVVIHQDSDTPYIRAIPLIVGAQDTDAALLQVNTTIGIPTISVGDERAVALGSRVEYIGYPMNLGKLYFEGYVSALKIGPPEYDTPQWNGDLGITIQIAPGSSGSALIDPTSGVVIGVMTGATTNRFGGVILSMATPASKVRQLVQDYKDGHTARSPLFVRSN